MLAFHYRALNTSNTELSGVIEAPDEQSARLKLSELGVSVVTIEVVSGVTAPEAHEEKKVFSFEAKDKNNKKVVGTIVSSDPLAAYTRLFEVYQLNVGTLTQQNTPEKDARAMITNARAEYEKLHAIEEKKKEEQLLVSQKEAEEKAQLNSTVETTVSRIKEFLQSSGPDLIPEERETIQSYIDQLIRIKDSSNLDHVRTTCSRMLEHIQKQELFIHERDKIRESSQLKLTTRNLLDDLKKTGLNKDIQIGSFVRSLETQKFTKNLLAPLFALFPPLSPELQKLKDERRAVERNISTYFTLLVSGKSKALRMEAWESIKTLWRERGRLVTLYNAKKIELSAHDEKNEENSGPPRPSFMGWTLFFFLVVYVVTYPLGIKDFGMQNLPDSIFFYKTTFTKSLTLFLFIEYCALTIEHFWLKRSIVTTSIVFCSSAFLFLLLAINLM